MNWTNLKYKFDLFFSRIRNMYMNGKLKITVKSYDHDYYNFKIISSINTRKDRLTGIIYSKTRQMFVVDESIQLSATYKKNTIIMDGIVSDFAKINFVEDIIDTNNIIDYIYSKII